MIRVNPRLIIIIIPELLIHPLFLLSPQSLVSVDELDLSQPDVPPRRSEAMLPSDDESEASPEPIGAGIYGGANGRNAGGDGWGTPPAASRTSTSGVLSLSEHSYGRDQLLERLAKENQKRAAGKSPPRRGPPARPPARSVVVGVAQ